MAARTLDQIGKFPIPGDSVIVCDRWAPHAAFAASRVIKADATHVDIECVIPAFDDRFTYRIGREAWKAKCQAPNRAASFIPAAAGQAPS